ncbi:hypothetical protein ABPG72_013148 [Tetrahymena utriculariae]
MQQDLESESLIKLQKIAKHLKEKVQLQVINLDAGKGSFGQVVIAEHLISKPKYVIKILSIFDGFDSVSEYKLQEAKKEALFLRNANHPNIFKYVDEFQIGFNYQYTKYSVTTSKHQFVSLACQTLSVINYLQYDFGLAKQIQEELNSSLILTSIPKGALFYYPPELIKQLQISINQNKKEYFQDFNGDIWAFGIYFYILAGAPLNSCFQLKTKGYKNLPYLDQSLNQILSQILSLDPSHQIILEMPRDQSQTRYLPRESWLIRRKAFWMRPSNHIRNASRSIPKRILATIIQELLIRRKACWMRPSNHIRNVSRSIQIIMIAKTKQEQSKI